MGGDGSTDLRLGRIERGEQCDRNVAIERFSRRRQQRQSRCRLWKVALQALAVRLGMPIHVCHFPPGTSKWNTIEHRMFYHITQNWRGRPLVSHEVIINLIANTTTQADLKIRAELDRGNYPGIKITDAELSGLNLKLANFHGDWNYTLLPQRKKT